MKNCFSDERILNIINIGIGIGKWIITAYIRMDRLSLEEKKHFDSCLFCQLRIGVFIEFFKGLLLWILKQKTNFGNFGDLGKEKKKEVDISALNRIFANAVKITGLPTFYGGLKFDIQLSEEMLPEVLCDSKRREKFLLFVLEKITQEVERIKKQYRYHN